MSQVSGLVFSGLKICWAWLVGLTKLKTAKKHIFIHVGGIGVRTNAPRGTSASQKKAPDRCPPDRCPLGQVLSRAIPIPQLTGSFIHLRTDISCHKLLTHQKYKMSVLLHCRVFQLQALFVMSLNGGGGGLV